MKINIYGYDKNNKLVATSEVQGNINSFLEEDLYKDQGKSLLIDALIAAGDERKSKIHKCVVSITGEKKCQE